MRKDEACIGCGGGDGACVCVCVCGWGSSIPCIPGSQQTNILYLFYIIFLLLIYSVQYLYFYLLTYKKNLKTNVLQADVLQAD